MKALLISMLALCAQDGGAVLHWKDGGQLRGAVAPSHAGDAGEVRFNAPQFTGVLVLERGVLDAIEFLGAEVDAGGAFRVVTTTDDVWTADIVGSDESSLTFRSERLGDVRVPRTAIRTLHRTLSRADGAGVLLDASRFAGEGEDLLGPIEELRFVVFESFDEVLRRTQAASGIPANARGPERVTGQICDNLIDDILLDFDVAPKVFEGSRSRGFIDLGLNPSAEFQNMAMVFEGRFTTEAQGRHTFVLRATHGARLFIDGQLVVEGHTLPGGGGGPGKLRSGLIELTSGDHDLRLVYFNFFKDEFLSLWITGPDGEERSLSGTNANRNWERGPSGHAHTQEKDTRLWHPVLFPTRFEMEVEFVSSLAPQFLVALEGDGSTPALALETWDNLLVVTQGDVFEPLGTIEAELGAIDLRLVFDGEAGTLAVYDGASRALGSASGIRLPTGATGISIRNRGVDLKVRRLIVRSGERATAPEAVDRSRARVQLRDGRVLYGRLGLVAGTQSGASSAFVLAEDGVREDVDLADVERVLNPDAVPRSPAGLTMLAYADGAVLHGEVSVLGPDRVQIQPAFADAPLTCSLAGASRLTWNSPSIADAPEQRRDELETNAGTLRGVLSFGGGVGPIAFHPLGAAAPVELATSENARVRRSLIGVVRGAAYDVGQYPHVLHSRAGERVPCKVASWLDGTVTIDAPFLVRRELSSAHVKALDFSRGTLYDETYRTTENFRQVLDRALMVPRFRRKNPDDFVVVSRSADLLRGELISILAGVLQMDSKLKVHDIPVERLALIVDVEDRAHDWAQAAAQVSGARVTLSDGTVLVFEPDSVSDGLLRGHSTLYGDISIPTDRIMDVQLGPAAFATGEGTFAAWVAWPAPEPSWED